MIGQPFCNIPGGFLSRFGQVLNKCRVVDYFTMALYIYVDNLIDQ